MSLNKSELSGHEPKALALFGIGGIGKLLGEAVSILGLLLLGETTFISY